MARLTGNGGSLTFYTSLCGDYAAWSLNFAHPGDDDTSFSDTGTGASYSGCGTVDFGSIRTSASCRALSVNCPAKFGCEMMRAYSFCTDFK